MYKRVSGASFWLLGYVTFGIYPLVIWGRITKNMNKMARKVGEKTISSFAVYVEKELGDLVPLGLRVSYEALNNGMEAFPFNIIFTSHDHQLTQTVANRVIELTEDGFIDRMMSYDEYMNLFNEEQ